MGWSEEALSGQYEVASNRNNPHSHSSPRNGVEGLIANVSLRYKARVPPAGSGLIHVHLACQAIPRSSSFCKYLPLIMFAHALP